MVLLTDQLTQTMGRITTLEASIISQQQQGSQMKGGIFDKSKMLPDRLTREVEFKSWSEDYLEYIEAQDERLHDLLLHAQDATDPIDGTGSDDQTRQKSKALYRSLKYNVGLVEARAIINNVPDKNP